MKKLIKRIAAIIYFSPTFALAATLTPNNTDTSLKSFIGRIIDTWVLSLAGGLAVLFIIIGGLQYMTAAGSEERVKTAKRTLTYAIIGLVLVIFAYAIIKFISLTLSTSIFN